MTKKNDMQDETETGHYVASTAELADGERVITEIKGREIAIFNVDGEYHALGNFCPHQGGPISEGKQLGRISVDDGEWCYGRDDEIVSCPWHGWEFDIESGKHLAGDKFRVPTYDIIIRDDLIYIDL